MNIAQKYDVVIIGGGMVGASFAAALLAVPEQAQFKIAVLETQSLDGQSNSYQPSYDARVTALSYGSKQLYELLGIWPELSKNSCPMQKVKVSDQGKFGRTCLSAKEQKLESLGYVLENRWLGRCLLQHLENSEQVDFICPVQVEQIEPLSEDMQLQINHQNKSQVIHADLVVMADGGRSKLAQSLGIFQKQESYNQHAIVANIALDRAHQNIAYERFTETGPVALLPLPDLDDKARMGLIWTLDSKDVDRLMSLDNKAFLQEVNKRFGYRAGNFIDLGQRTAYPLSLNIATEQVRTGLAVIGNAAHTLHPIAGQGFNLALRGAVHLAAKLIDAQQQNKPLGSIELLDAFYQQQRQDQQQVIKLSDGILQIFTSTNPLLSFGRNLALQLFDNVPLVKKIFTKGAMGLNQSMPKLK